jgi:F0F1-type ATP synthase assembly protein I
VSWSHRIAVVLALTTIIWQSAPIFHAYGLAGGLLWTISTLGFVAIVVCFVEARAARERQP